MGPLNGVKVIELAGIGPGPFAGMVLADLGAEVISVERKSSSKSRPDCSRRGKRSIAVDLKSPEGVAVLMDLVASADVFFEGFRPGAVERLGLGPDDCFARNPKLVYGRMTGWGQYGPLAKAAGHDINYISITGPLAAIGRKGERPVPPLNLVGDFGGGAMFLIAGILAALYEAQKSGQGQVIDAAMTDGSALLSAFLHTMTAEGRWANTAGANILDGGAHFYNTYETLDGKYISIGSIEPQFYQMLVDLVDLPTELFADQNDKNKWPDLECELIRVFKTKTREQWCELLEGTDVCFAPILNYEEAIKHPHNVARNTFIDVDGQIQPAPAPRFSRTVTSVSHGAKPSGVDTESVLKDWGIDQQRIDALAQQGVFT